MLGKYGLYLQINVGGQIVHFRITDELEKVTIGGLGIDKDGTYVIITVTHSKDVNDRTSSVAIFEPALFDSITVGEFAVLSLMESIENRASFVRTCELKSSHEKLSSEDREFMEEKEKVEAKALPILENLIGSERLSEVKKRIENLSSPVNMYSIIDELNLFSEENGKKRH